MKQWLCHSLGSFGVYLACRPWRRYIYLERDVRQPWFLPNDPQVPGCSLLYTWLKGMYIPWYWKSLQTWLLTISLVSFLLPHSPWSQSLATPNCGTLHTPGCFRAPLFYTFSCIWLRCPFFPPACFFVCLTRSYSYSSLFKSQRSLPILWGAFPFLPTFLWHHC